MVTKARRPRTTPTRGRSPRKTARKPAPTAIVADDEGERDDPKAWTATAKLSSKRQITLPAAMVRALGLKPGDELMLIAMDNAIWMERRPQTSKQWHDRLYGSMAHVPEWRTKEDIDAWIRRERDSWDRDWDPDEPANS